MSFRIVVVVALSLAALLSSPGTARAQRCGENPNCPPGIYFDGFFIGWAGSASNPKPVATGSPMSCRT
jgi:hypothetical protein